jgi:23S rRNA (cytosine1962-C5)-methyltransferase
MILTTFNKQPKYQPKRLAVKLTQKGENYVLKGHPWLFSKSIKKINKSPQTGDLAVIFRNSDNRLIGIGLYDAQSDIRIKMLYHGFESTKIDNSFFETRIQTAYERRLPLLKTVTDSYRLIFGESDGFPGLIADVYRQVLVIKLYSEIWLPYLSEFLNSLIKVSNTRTAVIRLSRKLQQSQLHSLKDGDVIFGELEDEVVKFKEHGINFSANVIRGHKTGYFLDHRHNRKRVGELSKGKNVLDVFSYAGGFSVHALANGAQSVTSVDISAQAIEVAQFNAGLNPHEGTHKVRVGDAFEELNGLIKKNQLFDVVVIDPPSFAKQASEVALAKKKYAELARLGARVTKKNGKLILASCSSRVTVEAFRDVSLSALCSQGIRFTLEKTTFHDIDHPIGFPEAAYLKCLYLQIES